MSRLTSEYRRAWKAAHPVYGVWLGMRRNCGLIKGATPRQRSYYVGIAVCDEWLDYETFEEWALEDGWEKGKVLARIDKNKDFCPENCVWTSKAVNSGWRRNVRRDADGRSARDILGYATLGSDLKEQNILTQRIYRSNLKASRECEEARPGFSCHTATLGEASLRVVVSSVGGRDGQTLQHKKEVA